MCTLNFDNRKLRIITSNQEHGQLDSAHVPAKRQGESFADSSSKNSKLPRFPTDFDALSMRPVGRVFSGF
jgi:hypothetical protein